MSTCIKKYLAILLVVSSLTPSISFAQSGGAFGTGISAEGIIGTALECTGIVDKLFDKVGQLFGGLESQASQEVPVGDSKTREETELTKKQGEKANEKERCLDQIVRAAALMVMDALTQDIINWINTGFNGEPSFLRNDGAFWKGLANQEIEGFAADIGFNASLYPFGRDFLVNMITNTQSYFRQNAAYSLDRVIGHGQQTHFESNLAVGGWVGWEALAEPQNNPFGFELIAQQEISGRTTGSSTNRIVELQKEIDINGGFRSAKKCVDPEGYTAPPAGWSRVEAELTMHDPETDEITRAEIQDEIKLYMCEREEVQTPGNIVADQLTNVLGAPMERLQLADEFNEDISAIIDALLNQLITEGLTSLTEESDQIYNTMASGGNFSAYAALNQNPNNPGYQNWSNDVTTGYQAPNLGDLDLNNPNSAGQFLQMQQNYVAGLLSLTEDIQSLITRIYQLDYCIPGPRPNWQNEVDAVFQQLLLDEPNVQNLGADDPTNIDTGYYVNDILVPFVGVHISLGENSDSLSDYSNIIDDIWGGYVYQINTRYSSNTGPSVRVPASSLYAQIPNLEELYGELYPEWQSAALVYAELDGIIQIISNQEQYQEIDSDGDGVTDVDEAYQAFDDLSPQLPTQANLDQLAQYSGDIAQRLSVATGYLSQCRSEITQNGYIYTKGRLPYPTNLLSTTEQSQALTGIPPNQQNTDNFIPGVTIQGGTTSVPNIIMIWNNINNGGVDVNTPFPNLTTLESTLNSFNISGGTGILY
jgi:hypothetical protein